MDEATLIRDAQRGSTVAFDDLVRRYDQAILRLATRLTGSEHEGQDIYQEAFLKAYKNISRFRSESSFYTWMHRIVCNLCMDRLRSHKSRPANNRVFIDADGQEHDELEHLPDRSLYAQPERQVLRTELHKQIQIALRKLTPRERMVFELRHFEGLKLRVVGEILSTSEETAKNTLFRATHKLRNFLAHVRRPAAYSMRRSGSIA
jgi:RNA polymerase sigma-70 factor (ECF subfamily)